MTELPCPPASAVPWIKATIEGVLAGTIPKIGNLALRLRAAEKELVRLRKLEAVAKAIVAAHPADAQEIIRLLESALSTNSEGGAQ